MSSQRTHLETLVAQAHPDGGWSYSPGHPAHLEPTCLALLALSSERQRFEEAIAAGRAALARCAEPDGSFRLPYTREEAVWPTALALAGAKDPRRSLRPDRQDSDPPARPARSHTRQAEKPANIRTSTSSSSAGPGRRAIFPGPSRPPGPAWPCGTSARATIRASRKGMRLLLDRASDEGGINYGNRRILGRITEPIPGPTALMLLRLAGPRRRTAGGRRGAVSAAAGPRRRSGTSVLDENRPARSSRSQRRRPGAAALDEAILAAHERRQEPTGSGPRRCGKR